jgi:hypothetical protein
MGETYGELPTDVLDQPASLFWLNANIRMATEQFKQDMKKQADSAQTDAGVASPSEKNELVEANEDRADRREELQEQGGQPGLADQMEALQDVERGGQ